MTEFESIFLHKLLEDDCDNFFVYFQQRICVKLDLFLQASCKKKLHLPLLKSAFLGWGVGGVVLKWN